MEGYYRPSIGMPTLCEGMAPGPRVTTICETKENYHDKPRCAGGGNEDENLKPLWPTDHAEEDPYRHPGYHIIEILE